MESAQITQVLLGWQRDPKSTGEALTPAIYSELRNIAAALMRKERADHTLQPTALIHEAYVRLVRQEQTTWKDRAHFFGIAARVMRQILVDHARLKSARKRQAPGTFLVDGEFAVQTGDLQTVLEMDEVLTRMASWDARKLQVIEMHYFAGMKADEIAEALGLTLPTVRRDLMLAKAWLKEQLA